MADEITVNATLAYDDGVSDESLQVVDAVFSAGGQVVHKAIQTVGITQEAINLGDVASPGYAMFKNLDDTNYIDLKVATSGAVFARLDPDSDGDGKGGVALLKLGSGAQAPYAIADTASCRMAVFLIE